MATYSYTKTIGSVNTSQLIYEIRTLVPLKIISKELSGDTVIGNVNFIDDGTTNNLVFTFNSALTAQEETDLTTRVNSHTAIANFDTGFNEVGNIRISANEIYSNTTARTIISSSAQEFLSFAGTGAIDDCGFNFKIPEDYKANLRFRICWLMDGGSTNQARIAVNIEKGNDLTGLFTDTNDEVLEILDSGQTAAAWTIQHTSYVKSGLTYSIGDTVIVKLERDPGHASDTLTNTFYLARVDIKYDKI